MIIVCDFKAKEFSVITFSDWVVDPYLKNIVKLGNYIKNIGLETGLKCEGNAILVRKEKWEVKRQVPYY